VATGQRTPWRRDRLRCGKDRERERERGREKRISERCVFLGNFTINRGGSGSGETRKIRTDSGTLHLSLWVDDDTGAVLNRFSQKKNGGRVK
jgi:hypothetical protein